MTVIIIVSCSPTLIYLLDLKDFCINVINTFFLQTFPPVYLIVIIGFQLNFQEMADK